MLESDWSEGVHYFPIRVQVLLTVTGMLKDLIHQSQNPLRHLAIFVATDISKTICKQPGDILKRDR